MWVHVDPTETPKVSVMRFENSVEMSTSLADGSSPFIIQETVGSDSSSATHGSSTVSVAGKKRAPTKQWAEACEIGTAAATASAAARKMERDMMELPDTGKSLCFYSSGEGRRATAKAG